MEEEYWGIPITVKIRHHAMLEIKAKTPDEALRIAHLKADKITGDVQFNFDADSIPEKSRISGWAKKDTIVTRPGYEVRCTDGSDHAYYTKEEGREVLEKEEAPAEEAKEPEDV